MATQYSREADVALALKMADAADVISMARYQSQDLVITTKPDNTPVTDADKATEKALRDILAKERPEDGLVGEEFGTSGTDAKRYWVIDPLYARCTKLVHPDCFD
jgi:histidinol-phosphatase